MNSSTDLAPRRGRPPAGLALLVLGNATSLTANVAVTVAVPWLVLTSTGSAALAGLVALAGAAGAVVGGLGAGRAVDLLGPVHTSVVADAISGAAVLPLPVLLGLGALEIWHVVALALVGTLADSAGATARLSLVPRTADEGGYPRAQANALFTSAEHVGYLVGAPLAGLLLAVAGPGGATSAAVAAFALAAASVSRLAGRVLTGQSDQRTAAAADLEPRSPRATLRETAAFITADPALRALVVFPTTAVLLVGPLVPILLPVLAREVFADPVVLGVMVAAYGAGGLLGTAAFGALGHTLARRRLCWGVFVVWPATYAAMTWVPSLGVTLGALVVLGAATGSLVPLMATVRQERTPDRLLPRVVGLSTATIPVAAPVGTVLSGLLVDHVGLHQTMVGLTCGAAVVGGAVLRSRGVRALDDQPVPAPECELAGTC